jgi:hypothetical protein
MEETVSLWRIAANAFDAQQQTADRDGPSGWGLGKGLQPPNVKNKIVMRHLTEPWTWIATEHNKQ